MRLRFVHTCHFGKSELTNFLEVLTRHPEFIGDSKHKLRLDDVILLVSKTGNQLVFLHDFDEFERKRVLRSVRFRLANGVRWNPLMLANYAKSVGVVLTGLQTYEAHVRALLRG